MYGGSNLQSSQLSEKMVTGWTILDEWAVIIVRSGSIVALTAIAAILARHSYKGSMGKAVVSILGIFAGIAGASHGLGEILQGDISSNGIFIAA
jgi:hypothetical protein